MLAQFRTNNRKPKWSRFISCTVLGFYLCALVAAPALHWHLFEHSAISYSEQSDTGHVPVPNSENDCPLCEFLRAAVPFFVDYKPVLLQTDVVVKTYFTVSNPPVAYVTILPPCRAPPVV